jgi:hypothetical protein
VNQFIPLVEFAFDMPMPHEGKGTGTMNPGVAYVSEKWQVLVRRPSFRSMAKPGMRLGCGRVFFSFSTISSHLCLESHCSVDEGGRVSLSF